MIEFVCYDIAVNYVHENLVNNRYFVNSDNVVRLEYYLNWLLSLENYELDIVFKEYPVLEDRLNDLLDFLCRYYNVE